MSATLDQIREQAKSLPDLQKLALVDEILASLDHPNPELDAAWLSEVRERRAAYRAGKMESAPFHEVVQRYRRP